MDVLDEGVLRFWKLMNQHNVQYIMVGGFAVNLHGYARTTADMDVWIADTPGNRRQLGFVLAGLGYQGLDMEHFQFVPGWGSLYIGPGIQLDMMTEMKGVDAGFTECLAMASLAEIEGLIIPFLHLNQLIANKKAVNRPKDRLDVAALEKIRQMLRQQQSQANL
jgi:hypothetical protein